MKTNNNKLWCAILCFLILSTLGLAQAGRGKGRLFGTVVDEQGNPVPQAIVNIEFEKGGLQDKTECNKKGEWGFVGLGKGNFRVTVSAEGFLDNISIVFVKQLEKNPPANIILLEDKEKKARVKDEASLLDLDKGNQLFSERKFDEALEIFKKFAELNPTIYQIYFNIGDVYREKSDFEKAIEQYNLALAKAREKADLVMQAKALAALRQSKFKEAQESFTQSIALNPKDEILAYNVAEIFFGNNQTDKAIEYYQLAIQIKPEWSEPYLKIGYALLNKGDIPKAVESFNEFLKRDPESAQAPVIKGLIDSLSKTK
jgi:tetratricopeptide (TPR) repeat protein